MLWFRILWSMRVTMGNAKILSPAQIRGFLEASDGIDFSGTERAGVYQWIEETLQGDGQDQAHDSGNWGASAARYARPAWLPSLGHRTPARAGRREECVPHQRGGRGDAVGRLGLRAQDQRALSGAGAGGDAGAI